MINKLKVELFHFFYAITMNASLSTFNDMFNDRKFNDSFV